MEEGENLLLKSPSQINEQVPAGQQVELRKWRIPIDVLFREDADVAHGFGDLVPPVLGLGEKARETLRGDVLANARVVNAVPRLVDDELARVRPEDLERD